jgi:hypothetical protein
VKDLSSLHRIISDNLNREGGAATVRQENRRHQRIVVDVLGITGRLVFLNTVTVRDVSISGVCLEAPRRLEVGRTYAVSMRSQEGTLTVRAIAVWSDSAVESSDTGQGSAVYRAGMYFTDMTPESLRRLVDFIASFAGHETVEKTMHAMSGLRCNMRYALDASAEAVVVSPEDFHVRKISPGGMLVTLNRPLQVGDRYSIELQIPSGSRLSVQGRIASQTKSSESDRRYDTGIEFLNLSEEDETLLRNTIAPPAERQ